jgi:hypothetical protein
MYVVHGWFSTCDCVQHPREPGAVHASYSVYWYVRLSKFVLLMCRWRQAAALCRLE